MVIIYNVDAKAPASLCRKKTRSCKHYTITISGHCKVPFED